MQGNPFDSVPLLNISPQYLRLKLYEAAVLLRALLIVLYIFCFAEKCFNCGGRGQIKAYCSSGPSDRAKGAQRGKWGERGDRRPTGGRRPKYTGHKGNHTVTLQFF